MMFRLSLGGQRLLQTFGVLREIIDDGDSQQHARTPFYLDDTTAAVFFASPIGAGKCAIEEELGGIGLCADNIILSDNWHWADAG